MCNIMNFGISDLKMVSIKTINYSIKNYYDNKLKCYKSVLRSEHHKIYFLLNGSIIFNIESLNAFLIEFKLH